MSISTELFDRGMDFAVAGRLNLTIPKSQKYSALCQMVAAPFGLIAFVKGASMLDAKKPLRNHFKTKGKRSMVLEAYADQTLFTAIVVKARSAEELSDVTNVLQPIGTDTIFFSSRSPYYPQGLNGLVDWWQASSGSRFTIVESTFCNGGVWGQWAWDSDGLCRDLSLDAWRIVSRIEPYLVRDFQDSRLNVVEFSGPRKIYSKNGVFQHLQKIGREYVFLQKSGSYASSAHDFATNNLDEIAVYLTSNEHFELVVHRYLTH